MTGNELNSLIQAQTGVDLSEDLSKAQEEASYDMLDERDAIIRFADDIFKVERNRTESELMQDKNFIDASKQMYFKDKKEKPNMSDEEMAKWGLDYISQTSYNLAELGSTALSVDDYSLTEKLSLAYMFDALDEKDVTSNGVFRALKGVVTDPSTYLGVGIFTKVLGRGGNIAFKKNLMSAIKTSAIETGMYTGTEDIMTQTIEGETKGKEYDPLQTALATAVGSTLGAIVPVSPKIAGDTVKGVSKTSTKIAEALTEGTIK